MSRKWCLPGIMEVRELEEDEKERKDRGRKCHREELFDTSPQVHCPSQLSSSLLFQGQRKGIRDGSSGKASHRLSDYYFAFLGNQGVQKIQEPVPSWPTQSLE